MATTPIYIKAIKLENLKTFGRNVHLNFEKPDGTLSRWTLILGDNGIGKSTLLQCVAWMKPSSQDRNSEITIDIKDSEPLMNAEENDSLVRLVRKGIKSETEHTYVEGTFVAGQKIGTKKGKGREQMCRTRMDIWLDNKGKLKDVKYPFYTNAKEIFLYEDFPLFCYSASRVLGRTNIYDPEMEDTIFSFLADTTTLYDAEEILHTVNYAIYGAIGNEKKKYENYLDKIKQVLQGVLPDFAETSDMQILTPKQDGNRMAQGKVLLTTKHGKKIEFGSFSLGYKTVMSWVIDLSWRMFNKFPQSANPFAEPAIVIIDEIDLHLHPVWQRLIIDELSNHFENVQFIATAHSPLMVQAAMNENYAVLKFDANEVQVINEPEVIDGWRVDQILTSEFFGLKTSRGPDYEQLLNTRKKLLNKKKLSKKDKEELKKITTELSEFPVGETPDEIKNRMLISELVATLKTKKVVIKA